MDLERRTARRRLGGLLLAVAVVLATAAALIVARQFYLDNRSFGYDWHIFYTRAQALRQGHSPYSVRPIFFIATPQMMAVVCLFLPLGELLSCLLWGALSALMLALSVVLTLHALGCRPTPLRALLGVWLFAVWVPVLLMIVSYTQISAPVVLAYAGALWLFTRGREGSAGAVLGLALLLKPQIAFLCLPLLLYRRRWRASAAYLAAAATGSLLSLAVVGPDTFRAYVAMQHILNDWSLHNGGLQFEVPGVDDLLRGFWPSLTPASLPAMAINLILVGLAARYWSGPWQPGSARFAAGWGIVIVVTVLISPYCHYYDLVLLGIPMTMLAAVQVRKGGPALLPLAGWMALGALYLGPDLRMLYRLHLMVPALLLALAVLWRLGSVRSSHVLPHKASNPASDSFLLREAVG